MVSADDSSEGFIVHDSLFVAEDEDAGVWRVHDFRSRASQLQRPSFDSAKWCVRPWEVLEEMEPRGCSLGQSPVCQLALGFCHAEW